MMETTLTDRPETHAVSAPETVESLPSEALVSPIDRVSPVLSRVDDNIVHTFYQESPLMMGVVELRQDDLILLNCNQAAGRFLGVAPELAAGRCFSDMGLTPAQIADWLAHYTGNMVLNEPARFEYRAFWNNTVCWLSNLTVFLGKSSAGHARFSFVTDDITERKQHEQALLESQGRLELLNSIAADVAAGLSIETVIRQTLPRLERLFPEMRVAYSTVDEAGVMQVVHTLDPPSMPSLRGLIADLSVSPRYWQVLQERAVISVRDIREETLEISPGIILPAEALPLRLRLLKANTCAVLNVALIHSDRVVGLLCTASSQPRDWTIGEVSTLREVADALALALKNAHDEEERRQSERALRKSNKRTLNILESITDAFFTLDREWRFTYLNSQAEEIVGCRRSELLGKSLWDVFPQTRELAFHTQYYRAVARQVAVDFEEVWPGSDLWLRIHAYPSQDGLSVYAQNITAHRLAEQGLVVTVEKLKRSLDGIVRAMSFSVEIRDPYTAGHQRRVSLLAGAIAARMGYSEEEVQGIRIAGLLHDVGKIAVPAEILSRPGILTPPERSLIESHALVGYNILSGIQFESPVAQVALQHHERLNGSGYPNGLSGDAILPEARLMAVADVVEAMASHRPYRPALGLEVALTEILQYKDIRYDGQAVQACFDLLHEAAFDFEHFLNLEARNVDGSA